MKIKPSARTHQPPATYKRRKPEFYIPPSRQWYAVIVNVNAERKALAALSGMFATYLPVQVVRRRAGGRKPLEAIHEKPLFPRYLFVASRELAFPFFNLRGVSGVESIVKVEGRPMPIPHSVIEAIMRRDHAGEFVAPGIEKNLTLEDMGLSTGENVTMIEGAFQGISGIIKALMPHSHALVMLNMFGQSVPATVPLAQIEKVA